MATIRENSISDHRPKTIWIKTNKKAWRHAGREKSVRKVNREKLRITENKEIFRERVNQRYSSKEQMEEEESARVETAVVGTTDRGVRGS